VRFLQHTKVVQQSETLGSDEPHSDIAGDWSGMVRVLPYLCKFSAKLGEDKAVE
jgi:hypothetical protein